MLPTYVRVTRQMGGLKPAAAVRAISQTVRAGRKTLRLVDCPSHIHAPDSGFRNGLRHHTDRGSRTPTR